MSNDNGTRPEPDMRKRVIYMVALLDDERPQPWIFVAEKDGYLELRPIELDEDEKTLYFEDTNRTVCFPWSRIRYFVKGYKPKEYEMRPAKNDD